MSQKKNTNLIRTCTSWVLNQGYILPIKKVNLPKHENYHTSQLDAVYMHCFLVVRPIFKLVAQLLNLKNYSKLTLVGKLANFTQIR